VPALLLAISGDRGQVGWIPRTSLRAVAQLCYVLSGASRDVVPGSAARYFMVSPDGLRLSLLLLYSLAIAIALIRSRNQQGRAVIYSLLCLTTPIGLVILASFFKPLFVTRYLILTLPFFIITAAIGITGIPWRAAAVAVTVAITVLSLIQDDSYYTANAFQDWRGAVRLVAERAKPGDVLMVYPDYNLAPVEYYVARLDHSTEFPRSILMKMEESNAKHPYLLAQQISKNRAQDLTIDPGARIWFVSAFYDHSDERLLKALQSDRQITGQPDISGIRLLLLESRPR
jgi:hypothetical protein